MLVEPREGRSSLDSKSSTGLDWLGWLGCLHQVIIGMAIAVAMAAVAAVVGQDHPNFISQGVPSTCFGGWTNGEWKYIGKTADGRPYYKQWDSYDSMFYFMYYEKDCDGNAGNTGAYVFVTRELICCAVATFL